MTAAVLAEKRVLEIWQGSLQNRTDLVTAENEPIEIIYPGRLNDDRGADLRDAVIATRQGLLKGDIEIHVKSSSWWAHRHHLDPAYNRVILHVVYRDDAAKTTVLENGCKVPTLALRKYCGTPAGRDMPAAIPPMPCRNTFHRRDISFIGQVLEAAGDERFLSFTDRFQETIARSGAGQALYRGIMTALGYSKNKAAMAELADRLPLPRLEATALAGAPEDECLAQYQARLIGTAGLLPSQRGVEPCAEYPIDEWIEKLENTWAAFGEKSAMSAADWHFFKIRPGNYPARRLAAMSHLLLRYRQDGLLAGLQGILQAAADNAGHSLEASLLVNPDSFWGRYLDFGQPGGGVIPALLGRERAADITVNVLLPFAAAAGFNDSVPELPEKALKIYRAYRAPAENTLVKHMNQQLGIGRHCVNSARRQQGLIHSYKTRCSQGQCHECPLNPIKSDSG